MDSVPDNHPYNNPIQRDLWLAVDRAASYEQYEEAILVFADYWEERCEASARVIRLALNPTAPLKEHTSAVGCDDLVGVVRAMTPCQRRCFACHCVSSNSEIKLPELIPAREAVEGAMEYELRLIEQERLHQLQANAWTLWIEMNVKRPGMFRYPMQNLTWASVRASGAASQRLNQSSSLTDAMSAAKQSCTYGEKAMLMVAIQHLLFGRAVLPSPHLERLGQQIAPSCEPQRSRA